MKTELKITVITPTFNRAHTLERVYNSLIEQNYKIFKWLIMDDGSTDNTSEYVYKLKEGSPFEIEYVFKPNRKKFLTLMDGIYNYIHTDYFIVMDSDDEFVKNSIEILFNEIEKIKDDKYIGSVCGNVVDSNGNLVGTEFPLSPMDCSIFEMRHKYKVKGGKMSIQQTSKFKKVDFNIEYYKNKGYIPDDIWQNYFDSKFKTRFINEFIKVYHFNPDDKASLSSSRYKKRSAFGIMESYRTHLEVNQKHFLKFPLVMSKKMIGYIYFGLNNKNTPIILYNNLSGKINKIFFLLLFIPSSLYKLINPLK
ncbi:MAG: glycosyltransferase family 2 protein [Moheibacter sp.]